MSNLFQVIGTVIRLDDAKVELRLARRTVIQPIPVIWSQLAPNIDNTQLAYVAAKGKLTPIDLSPGPLIDRGGSGGAGFGLEGTSRKWGGGLVGMAAVILGAELDVTNCGMYNHAAGSSIGSFLTNGAQVVSLSSSGAGFSGFPYSGISTTPLSGSVLPSGIGAHTITFTNQFVYVSETSGNNIIDVDFNAAYQAANYPSPHSTLVFEVKLRNDTGATTVMDWFPDGASGHMTGGAVILDPTSLNRAVADSSSHSGHFQCETPILTPGSTYTFTLTMTVTNS